MTAPAVEKPLTGEEYLESMRDGREVWIEGERVADVTEHPAFRNAARQGATVSTNQTNTQSAPVNAVQMVQRMNNQHFAAMNMINFMSRRF